MEASSKYLLMKRRWEKAVVLGTKNSPPIALSVLIYSRYSGARIH